MSLSASPTISPATSSIFSKFTLILIKSVEAVSVFVTPPSSWWVSVSLRLWWWVVGIAALVTYVRWGLADSLNHTSHVKGGWNWFFLTKLHFDMRKLCHIIKSPPLFRVAPASLSKEWSHDPSDFPQWDQPEPEPEPASLCNAASGPIYPPFLPSRSLYTSH